MSERLLFPALERVLQSFAERLAPYPPSRQALHTGLRRYIHSAAREGTPALLHFICTHNSRRSHMAHLWATALAWRLLPDYNLSCYSGGTEATALHVAARAALEHCGFRFAAASPGPNTRFAVTYAEDAPSAMVWSKRYDDPTCPQGNFAAIMTCSEAWEACPVVTGAALRVPLSYSDPKESDGTDHAAEVYLNRALEIGAEIWTIFSHIHKT